MYFEIRGRSRVYISIRSVLQQGGWSETGVREVGNAVGGKKEMGFMDFSFWLIEKGTGWRTGLRRFGFWFDSMDGMGMKGCKGKEVGMKGL